MLKQVTIPRKDGVDAYVVRRNNGNASSATEGRKYPREEHWMINAPDLTSIPPLWALKRYPR